MTTRKFFLECSAMLASVLISLTPCSSSAANGQILGWNNLGMHCMDSDYSVFSILPPYNTIEAQLIVGGRLITNGTGYTVTYEAMADPSGSFNSTSFGKGNFYGFASQLYAPLPVNMGLAGWAMPGSGNVPQAMLFEQTNQPAGGVFTPVNWFRAEGIPLMPYDDGLRKNPYPMMRLVARDGANTIIATNSIVLPVSDEMDCRACHASGSYTNALPAAGWANDINPERDYRLNILRLHDEKQFAQHETLYTNALAARGFDPLGLYAGVVTANKPVLCATCHASEALGTASYSTIPPLTASVHSQHAAVLDPTLHITLENSANRASCYRCHPGSTTKCLRGAMGAAVAADGSMAMQCQSCHGSMSKVGASNRVGWFMEPLCQSCHSGTATSNNGQIRYTSVFEAGGAVRVAVDQTFATQPNTPATGLSLYRFSAGHGGLQCSACHGSTHAEFPSTHVNDNVRNLELQGHVGVMVECTACHTTVPSTVNGGPHGMHPVGQDWVNRHPGLLEGGSATKAQCQACHGTDYRGTVLSRIQGDRQLTASLEGGSISLSLYRGALIGCYNCHNGPNSEGVNKASAPIVSDVSAVTAVGQSVNISLPLTGAGATLRVVSQPAHGSAALNGSVVTYYPDPGFQGLDSFTFAAYDGAKNSNLGTGRVAVGTIIDTNAPTVRITSPTSNPTFSTTTSPLTIGGTASDNLAVTSVTWSSDRGGSGTASGTTSWTASGIALQSGANVITVTARDAANNSATDSLTLTYTTSTSLIVTTSGSGTFTPNLNGQPLQIGKSYKMTAKPGAGYVFANWTGSISASTPAITFTYQGGMMLQANFVPNPFVPVQGNYSGLFFEQDLIRQNSSGAFTLTVSSGGAFSGKLQSGNSRFTLSGQFDSAGHAHMSVARPNMNPLAIALQLDLTNSTDLVSGTVSDSAWVAQLSGDRAIYDGKTKVAPQTGGYTMIIPDEDDLSGDPYGTSYAVATVNGAGVARLSGALADGVSAAFVLQSSVSKNGRIAIYLPLYKGLGSVLGWVQFTNSAAEDITGTLHWFKPTSAATTFYPQGFTMDPLVYGSRYVQPAKGVRVLNFTNGQVILDGGNLVQNGTNQVTLNTNNQVTSSNRLNLGITLSLGVFKGSTGGIKPIKFSGVVLQKQNLASGFFVGTNESGNVYFGP